MSGALCHRCGIRIDEVIIEAGGMATSCAAINGSPCVPCIKAAEFKSKISATKAYLNELEGELSRVHTAANAVHDPFHRLPVELVTRIIYLCGTDPLDYPRSTLNVKPLSFGNVCRGWRNIIYDSPTLWTKLDITILHCLNNSYAGKIRPNFLIPRQWLARARTLPLDIGVRFLGPSAQLGYNELEELYAVLREHAAQWKVVRFWNLPHDMLYLWLSTPSPQIDSILEKLKISMEQCNEMSDEDDAENSILLSCHSPSSICLLQFSPSFIILDWSKLTSIIVKPYYFRFREIRKLFEAAPALQYLRVSCSHVEYSSVSFEVPEPFHHLQLQHLFIAVPHEPEYQSEFEALHEFADSSAVEKLLRSVRLPALVSFSLEGRCNLPTSALQELLIESRSPIKKLSLSNLPFQHDYFSEEGILDILATIPHIESLTIKQSNPRDEPCFTSRFFSRFTGATSLELPLLPSLKTFVYTARRSYPWTTLEDIVRRLQLGPLKKAKLGIIGTQDPDQEWAYGYLPDYIDRDIAQRLSALSVKGLTIKDWPFGRDFIRQSLRASGDLGEDVDGNEDVANPAHYGPEGEWAYTYDD